MPDPIREIAKRCAEKIRLHTMQVGTAQFETHQVGMVHDEYLPDLAVLSETIAAAITEAPCGAAIEIEGRMVTAPNAAAPPIMKLRLVVMMVSFGLCRIFTRRRIASWRICRCPSGGPASVGWSPRTPHPSSLPRPAGFHDGQARRTRAPPVSGTNFTD